MNLTFISMHACRYSHFQYLFLTLNCLTYSTVTAHLYGSGMKMNEFSSAVEHLHAFIYTCTVFGAIVMHINICLCKFGARSILFTLCSFYNF